MLKDTRRRAVQMNENMIQIQEGKYAIGLQTLKKDADEPSAMANYLSQMAVVTKEDAFFTLSLLLQSQETITGFQIERDENEFVDAIERQVDTEAGRRYEMFEIQALPAILRARVQYEVTHEGKHFTGDEILRLAFKEDSLEKIN